MARWAFAEFTLSSRCTTSASMTGWRSSKSASDQAAECRRARMTLSHRARVSCRSATSSRPLAIARNDASATRRTISAALPWRYWVNVAKYDSVPASRPADMGIVAARVNPLTPQHGVHQRPPGPAVAFGERVNRLELGVCQGGVGENGQVACPVAEGITCPT